MSPEPCDARRLELLLRNSLPDEGARAVEAHVLSCPSCQCRLDELAGGARWWADVGHYLGGEDADRPATVPGAEPRLAATGALPFLEPSDHPGALGRLGGYEVLGVLGQGGTGTVLRAFDPSLHRHVAIKVLAAEYAAHPAARQRFAREARAAAAVSHEHVVAVHAVAASATPPYLVMAFVAGQSLQQRLDRSGPLGLEAILRIGMQTAAGLAAAHAQGLVHRDVKPANIMLENGVERVRLTDFGLARAVDDASVTRPGDVAGTPQYMAPEQARGEAVDQRADLFALGSTLYAMCTGHAPYRGRSCVAVLRQVCDTEPAPVRASRPELPPWLEGIIHKLHAKDPAQRFQSAAEVAVLLEGCLAHVQQPDSRPLPPPAEELGRPFQTPRRPGTRRGSWRAAAVAAAGILGAAALFLLPRPAAHPEATDRRARAAAPAGSEALVRAEEEFQDDVSRLRARLEEFGKSLDPPPGEGPGWEAAIGEARQRADRLQRQFSPAAPDPDPIDGRLESVRRRLEVLRQQIGRLAE
jgi:hypothetical protein